MKTITITDAWFGDQPIHVTATRCPDRGIWTVKKAVQRGWDITNMFRERVHHNAAFAAKFVTACEGDETSCGGIPSDERHIPYPTDWPPYYHVSLHEPCDMLDGPCCCGAWHHKEDWSRDENGNVVRKVTKAVSPT